LNLTDNHNDRPADNFTASKTARIFGLFMAAVMAVTPGCTSNNGQNRHVHVDKNGDGYCDEDGELMNSSRSGFHRNYFGGGYGGTYNNPQSGSHSTPNSTGQISTGTAAPKGGIGSYGVGGGG
jgi:hypothetical protein